MSQLDELIKMLSERPRFEVRYELHVLRLNMQDIKSLNFVRYFLFWSGPVTFSLN